MLIIADFLTSVINTKNYFQFVLGICFRLIIKAMIAKVTAIPFTNNIHSEEMGAGSISPKRKLFN
jgi:hypothetical protein